MTWNDGIDGIDVLGEKQWMVHIEQGQVKMSQGLSAKSSDMNHIFFWLLCKDKLLAW